MKTKQIYYTEPYRKTLTCNVIDVKMGDNLTDVVLDQTIFYPEGGGQPSDKGLLGEAKVVYVRLIDGEIVHQIKGRIEKDQKVQANINWDRRYKYMKRHTAGHVLHDVLMTMTNKIIPIRGGHGNKAFLEYQGEVNSDIKSELEAEINRVIQQDLPVITSETTQEELIRDCKFVPLNLPKSKKLRMIKIGEFPPMPDGGVHVKSTKEIGQIWISSISAQENKTTIRYGVTSNPEK
ncbi:MAG: alanyl-tRNA editing protein [bacterium]|nr:alanyl-tRNA editing protein [bacterium]